MQVTFTPLYSGTFTPKVILEIHSEINLHGVFGSLQQGLIALEKFLDNPSNGYGPDTGLVQNNLCLILSEMRRSGNTLGTSVPIEINVSDGRFSFTVAEHLPMEVFGIPRSGSLQLKEFIKMLGEKISPQ